MGRAHEVRKESIAKTAAKKSKLYARYGKQLYNAAKNQPDPEANIELKRLIERAKKDQVPKDIIDRALEKAKGGANENYNETRYEFIGPGGSLFIVECLTDNPARTIANVRNCFTKTGGKSGSVSHLFEHCSFFSFKGDEEKVLELLIENYIDVNDIEEQEGYVSIIAEPNQYSEIKQLLLANLEVIEFENDEIIWLPLTYVTLNKHEYKDYEKLIELLEDDEDINEVYHNVFKQE